MADVRIVHQDGRFATVPEANLAKAEKLGWRVEEAKDTVERRKGTAFEAGLQGAGAGLVGGALALPKIATAAGAAVLGAEDPLAQFSGRQFLEDASAVAAHLGGGESEVAARETRESILANQEAHPLAFTGGEVAGALVGAGAMGRGATALAGRAAEAAGLVGRGAQVATGLGAATLEGAGLGADAASEQAWVRDQKVTAEQSLAGIGMGAIFGLGTAGAVAGLGAGLPRLASVVRRGGAETAVEGGETALARAAAGAAGASDDTARALVAAEEKAAPAALEVTGESVGGKARRWLSGAADEAAVNAISRGNQRSLKRLGFGSSPSPEKLREVGRLLNETGGIGGSEGAMLEKFAAKTEEAGERIGGILKRLDADAPYVDAEPLLRKLDDFVLEKRASGWGPEGDQVGDFIEQRLEKLRQTADAGILRHSDLHDFRRYVDKLSKWEGKPSPTQEAVRDMRGIVEEELESAIGKGGESFGNSNLRAEYERAKELYSVSRWARDSLAERVNVRNPASRSFSLTDYGAGAAALVASGGMAPYALAAAAGNKLFRERGWSTFAQVARKLAGDAVDVSAAPAGAVSTARNLQAVVAHNEESIGANLARFLGGSKEGSTTRRARTAAALSLSSGDPVQARAAYRDHALAVQEVASMPQVAATRLDTLTGRDMSTYAPMLHTEMAAIVTRAAGYLSVNLPAPPTNPESITPQLDEPPTVSDSDLASYAARVEGVTRPLSLLEDLVHGKVSPEKVDAVKTVWPTLFARMRQNVFLQLAERTEPVEYEQRKLLDLALDGAGRLEPSLGARSLRVMGMAQKSVAAAEVAKQSGSVPQIGQMLATRSQQVAGA